MGLLTTSTVVFKGDHGYDFKIEGDKGLRIFEKQKYFRAKWNQYKFDLGYVVNELTIFYPGHGSETFVILDRDTPMLVGPSVNFPKEIKMVKTVEEDF